MDRENFSFQVEKPCDYLIPRTSGMMARPRLSEEVARRRRAERVEEVVYVRFPIECKRELDRLATETGTPRNRIVVRAVAHELDRCRRLEQRPEAPR